MRINIKLADKNSLDDAIKYLEKYRDDLLVKTKVFIDRLLDIGIDTAEFNSGEYKGYILFSKDFKENEEGITGVLMATDRQKITRWWYKNGELVSADISPMLMAEFGSGWFASVLDNVEGVGQGTFPGQTHAFDEDGWDWVDENGAPHHSYGETPTFPMHSASIAMLYEINRIAQEVFGHG